MLEVENLRFAYPGERGAIIQAHFTVATGRSAALMGPSGAGKSTLLHLIAGFLQPQQGDVRFAQRSLRGLAPSDRPLTYLFQAHNLFPHLTVWQNLAIGLHPGLKTSPQQNRAIARALEWVALQGYAERKPASLSGGQQQRVALARSLARNRPLLLLDEPFSGLDETLRGELVSLIRNLQQARDLTILLASHQRRDAEALGAEVVLV